MGVTIEQYRAPIGAHNNIRTKKDSARLEDNFCETMFVLFQLVITCNYDTINIGTIILPKCIFIFANKDVDTSI